MEKDNTLSFVCVCGCVCTTESELALYDSLCVLSVYPGVFFHSTSNPGNLMFILDTLYLLKTRYPLFFFFFKFSAILPMSLADGLE